MKQIDLNHAFEYSLELELSFEAPVKYVLTPAYPDPFKPQAENQIVTLFMRS